MGIVFDLLSSIQKKGGTIKPTHLLYKSNLSYQRMLTYVDELKNKGLIEEEKLPKGKQYLLTDEGYEFLANYSKMVKFVNSFGF